MSALLGGGMGALQVEGGPADPDDLVLPGAELEAAEDVLRVARRVAGRAEVAAPDGRRGEGLEALPLPIAPCNGIQLRGRRGQGQGSE